MPASVKETISTWSQMTIMVALIHVGPNIVKRGTLQAAVRRVFLLIVAPKTCGVSWEALLDCVKPVWSSWSVRQRSLFKGFYTCYFMHKGGTWLGSGEGPGGRFRILSLCVCARWRARRTDIAQLSWRASLPFECHDLFWVGIEAMRQRGPAEATNCGALCRTDTSSINLLARLDSLPSPRPQSPQNH